VFFSAESREKVEILINFRKNSVQKSSAEIIKNHTPEKVEMFGRDVEKKRNFLTQETQ